MRFHRWTVDTYAVQHPGKPEPRTIQSVHVHLLALYLLIERKADPDFATAAMGKVLEKKKSDFRWLSPPENLGSVTVVQVHAAKTPEEHGFFVQKWAESIWLAWREHHPEIKRLAEACL
jgi:hypothetical protein